MFWNRTRRAHINSMNVLHNPVFSALSIKKSSRIKEKILTFSSLIYSNRYELTRIYCVISKIYRNDWTGNHIWTISSNSSNGLDTIMASWNKIMSIQCWNMTSFFSINQQIKAQIIIWKRIWACILNCDNTFISSIACESIVYRGYLYQRWRVAFTSRAYKSEPHEVGKKNQEEKNDYCHKKKYTMYFWNRWITTRKHITIFDDNLAIIRWFCNNNNHHIIIFWNRSFQQKNFFSQIRVLTGMLPRTRVTSVTDTHVSC